MKKVGKLLVFLLITLFVFILSAQASKNVRDQQACEYARKNADAEIWQDYLRQFPNGICAFEARSEIKKLKSPYYVKNSEVQMIEENNHDRPVKQMVEIMRLRGKSKEKNKQAVMKIYSEIVKKTVPYQFSEIKNSPNRNILPSKNVSIIHIKNDYVSSANVMLFLMNDRGYPVVLDELEFNTEKKYNFTPGYYDFMIVIDRPDNKNVYVFKYSRFFQGGEVYVGEFKIIGKYNNSGECAPGYIRDDAETCIAPSLKIFDNCDRGTHLVENLCCEEGFNFIMDGHCSRYSDTVENVICPAGYHEAGKGRCCPTGMLFIDNKCQVPK